MDSYLAPSSTKDKESYHDKQGKILSRRLTMTKKTTFSKIPHYDQENTFSQDISS
ncbi:uncharacterized protein G2W53_003558 [Senna tora]|uniref:Uncharacterized protein n=1 Tax=Senna tora TaxID=362788 RepID=A0A835CII9_9FABA|nr:uncharacterized protein G2W53_003558 [Senna tora]